MILTFFFSPIWPVHVSTSGKSKTCTDNAHPSKDSKCNRSSVFLVGKSLSPDGQNRATVLVFLVPARPGPSSSLHADVHYVAWCRWPINSAMKPVVSHAPGPSARSNATRWPRPRLLHLRGSAHGTGRRPPGLRCPAALVLCCRLQHATQRKERRGI